MTGSLGGFGESWTVGLLSRQGYEILERNVRFRRGEIDIVARDGEDLVFIEVKCRRSGRFGSPEDSLTPSRFGRLTGAVEQYLQERRLEPTSYRIDVMAIEVGPLGNVIRHELLKGVEAPRW